MFRKWVLVSWLLLRPSHVPLCSCFSDAVSQSLASPGQLKALS